MKRLRLFSIASLLVMTAASCALAASPKFYLKSGDHVLFYGDSITEQRFYPVDVEAFVRTRFPNLHVRFVNSGVGGDRVTGGWAGPIDLRLERDVFPFKPNIVTIMLGMNDAGYRPFNQQIFDVYKKGYEHIITALQQHIPGVKIILIEPSPFDDVTYKPQFPGGYNRVLIRYSKFVRHLAAEHHLTCVDFNTPLVDIMKQSAAKDPNLDRGIIPGRVHPSAAGELVMAQALLEAWDAPSTVTSVVINAARKTATRADNTSISGLAATKGTVSWAQDDKSLPFPILDLHENWPQFPPTSLNWGPNYPGSAELPGPVLQPPWKGNSPRLDWSYANPVMRMTLHFAHFYSRLDDESLKVTGLEAGDYQLKIDGQPVGDFQAGQLASGINLARYQTPMLSQSYQVLALVWRQVAVRFYGWRSIQLPLAVFASSHVQPAVNKLLAALERQKEEIVARQYVAAQPRPHQYALIPVSR